MSENLTTVSVSWRKNRRNNRILSGNPCQSVRLDWQRKLVVFRPGQVFVYERWRGNKYGTVEWQIFILKAARNGDWVDDIAGVRPGAKLLLSAHGKRAAKRLLRALDQFQNKHDLEHLSEDVWGRLNCLIRAGFEPGFAFTSSLSA